MSQRFRLPSGGRVDRAKTLRFRFNGRSYEGYQGDTLASALLANGVHLVARGIKYHRPRGIHAAGVEEPNALVQLGRGARSEPNARATEIELFDGLRATSVNVWPSLAHDWRSINGLFAKLLVAGFYYKTFKGTQGLWQRVYEPMIRRAAGFGRAPTLPDPDRYDHMNEHCDVLVVGGGAAGLMAALTAGRAGARVMLVDEQSEPGGWLLGCGASIDQHPAPKWVAGVVAELRGMAEVVLLPRTTAFGYYDQNYVCLLERRADHLGRAAPAYSSRQRVWHVRARHVVLAAGAHERPLVFADNDRPGIMLAGAVTTYVRRYGVLPGRRAVIFTNNDSAYETALALTQAGADVVTVIDARAEPGGALAMAAREAGIRVLDGRVVIGTRGTRRVSGVELGRLGADGSSAEPTSERLDCDLLAVSGGHSPVVHLFSQSQGRLRFDETLGAFVPGEPAQPQQMAGAINGLSSLALCLADGLRAARAALEATGFSEATTMAVPRVEPEGQSGALRPLWLVPGHKPIGRGRAKHFVDLQNDTTAADILLARREGFEAVEHMKRYTLAGFGTDQGKTANLNALAILARATGRSIAETGTTTFRPPYTPVGFGALAGTEIGALSDPIRMTPMHDWHVAHGAAFENVGQWRRPWCYPRSGETMQDAVNRECLAVRRAVGVLDASTLGKIEIVGPDAAELLNRIYTNGWKTLRVGQVRYGLMCREDGMVFDDGTTARLAPERYVMTTTTGNAAIVLDWLEEYLQTEWPELKVYCTSVTEQWAVASIAGPKADALITRLAPSLDLSDAAFPALTLREGVVAGIPARLFRISFTGEPSYEINVPSDRGLALWEAVMEAGAPLGVAPYGTEAMHVLRAEKGFIIVGQETDGTVTPLDLGLERMVSRQKDFIGRRSLGRADTRRADRKQLVGLLTDEPSVVLPEGAQLVRKDDATRAPPVPMIGHVTSSYYSAVLGRSIALALVKGGRGRHGEIIAARFDGRTVLARIGPPVFIPKPEASSDG